MSNTPNYNLPLYDSEDKPNLRDQYNGAINMIDTQMKKQETTGEDNKSDIAEIKETITQINSDLAGKAPKDHASSDTAYGVGNSTEYGHLKITDAGDNSSSDGVAASPKLVNDTVSKAMAAKKLLCIGDSYARMEDASQISWCKYLQQYGKFADVKTYAEGGAGFITPGMSSHTFPQLAELAISEIQDKDSYGVIVVAGGRNDSLTTNYTVYYNAVSNMANRLKTAFPKARVVFVPFLWHNVRSYTRGLWSLAGAAIDACNANGVECVNWAWTWGLGLDSLYDGGIHPLSAGGALIASYINSALNGSYSGRTYVEKPNFGSGDCIITGCGGTMTVMVGGSYNNQDATLGNAFKCNTLGSCWSYIYSNGGSDGCVLILATKIAIFGGGNKGNIGGCLSMPW